MTYPSRVRVAPGSGAGFLSAVMSTHPVAALIRWLSRRALRWCYREMHFIGRERIPATGATMLFGNHPNDLPDVLAGYFTTGRQLRYVATIAGTTMPLAALTYRVLGVIPVTRIRDVRKMREKGVDVATVNRSAFDAVRGAFHAGDVVGVFPEGGVQDSSELGRLRIGVAKMALESLDDGLRNDVLMVAFGMQYEAPQTLRSDVIVEVGTPFSLREWRETRLDPTPAALSVKLHQELVAVSRASSNWANAGARDRLVAAVAAVNARPDEPLLETAARIQAPCSAVIEGRAVCPEGPVESATRLRALADELADVVKKAGGIGTSARDCARVLDAAGLENPQAAWPSWGRVAAMTIPGAVGLGINGPLQIGIWHLARRAATVRTDIVAWAIVPGLHLMFLGYVVLGGLIALAFRAVSVSAWWALPIVVLLPRLGDVGLAWRDDLRAIRLRARVRRFPESERVAIRAAAERVQSEWTTISKHPSQ